MRILKTLRQVLLYTSVGGLATLIDWGLFYFFVFVLQLHYLLATAIAFVISTFANWGFGRLFLFRTATHAESVWVEIVKIYLTTLIGLALNLLIMWTSVEHLALHKMLSKILATSLVFFWNFSIRKYVIYKI